MTTPRFNPVVLTHPSGVALFIGGAETPTSTVATMEIFDPGKGTFTEAGNMTQPREGEAIAVLSDGRLLITGGRTAEGVMTETAEICDLTTRTCKPVPSLPEPRADHTATRLPDGAVILVGGSTVGEGGTAWAAASCRIFLPWQLATPGPTS
jgi:hypothetical protein